MKTFFKITFFTSILLLISEYSHSQATSNLVKLENGKLKYTPFAMTRRSNQVNVIPDFSYAGYRGGGVPLPDVSVVKILEPSDGDNKTRIQEAIDEIEAMTPDANGFRGTLLLKKGTYEVSDQLTVKKGGVVLRGEGQGKNGTILFASKREKHTLILVGGSSEILREDTSTTQRITNSYVPSGTHQFDIVDASNFAVGDTISVKRTPNDKWITDLGMDEATLCTDPKRKCVGWTPSGYAIKHERIITGIDNNTITVNFPIVSVMEDEYGGGEISKASFKGRIANCGIENIRVESVFNANKLDYKGTMADEDHLWIAIDFRRVVHSWVKGVTAQYIGTSTVQMNHSSYNTVQDCAAIDYISRTTGGRRYGLYIDKGIGNLFQRCFTDTGRHDYAFGSRVTGPNVFLDCYADNTTADIGPHHRWTTGALFDNVRGGQIRVHNRKYLGTGHGWVAAQTMLWNNVSYNRDLKVASPTGGMNWSIGSIAKTFKGAGYFEHKNTPVTPRSLYLQQLKDRLGQQAVDNTTIPQQRAGDINDLLSVWKGEGELEQTNLSTKEIVVNGKSIIFKQFPNPTSSNTFFSFELTKTSPVKITIFDTRGRVVKQIENQFSSGEHKIEIELDLDSGMYVYQFHTSQYTTSDRLVVM